MDLNEITRTFYVMNVSLVSQVQQPGLEQRSVSYGGKVELTL